MTTEHWQQVKEIFHAALERDAAERPAFIAQACKDDESIRSQVDSLIAAHEKEGTFIDSPAYELAADWLVNEPVEPLIGRLIYHYRIVARIGAGGMGEVYLAEDTKLGRRVALKILPASFPNDSDRLLRFQQEARATSALNHPNIVTIYEVGEQNNRHYIATELIEGETLRQRLSRGRMEVGEALGIILQAASALTAAHEVGIVHRDVKPENIMLRRDGYVKVLDFGLAKLAERKLAQPELGEAPTLMQINTSPGMVMGTVNYMSPEQARGLEVDERTDIWSLGVVFYEMLSGQTPFQGATPTDVTVSILQKDPALLTSLSEEIPSDFDWIIRKSLRKEREERYQTIKEISSDLRSVQEEMEFEAKLERIVPSRASGDQKVAFKRSGELLEGASTNESIAVQTEEIKGATAVHGDPSAKRLGRPRIPLLAALTVLAVAVVGIALYKFALRGEKTEPFQAQKITRLTNHGKDTSAAISPDGKYFVYVLSDAGKQSIWLRQVSAANDTQIVPPAPVGVFGITFSRDGNDLYYVIKAHDPGTLYRIPVLGGTPVKLLEKIDSPVSFSPDGKRIAFVRGDYPNRGESGLFLANADGGNVLQIASRKLPELFYPIFFTGPSWSPDGQLVACAVTNTNSEGRVIAVRVEDGIEQILTKQTWPYVGRVEWLPDMSGLLLVAVGQSSNVSQIWHLSYPDGEARKVTNDLSFYRGLSLTADASRLLTVQISGIFNMWVAAGNDAERAVQLPSTGSGQPHGVVDPVQLSIGNVGYLGGNEGISWTPDNKIVFTSASGKQGDIWIMNSDGGNRKQLTVDVGNNHQPVVSPDGRYIVFTSERSGARNVWRMNIDGGDPQRLTSGLAEFLPTISPDGKWVLYSSLNSGRKTLLKVPLIGGAPAEIINREGLNPVVSADGGLIAYLFTEAPSPDAPPNRIAIIPFEGGEPLKVFEVPGGLAGARTILRWSRDGRSLIYTVINNNVSNIWSQPLDGGKPVQLTNFKEHIITAFDWSPDGRRLAVLRGSIIRDVVLISNAMEAPGRN